MKRFFLFILILTIGFLGCGKNPYQNILIPTSLSGAGTFTASPIALNELAFIYPLGGLNPPAHTLPTDHMYFFFTGSKSDDHIVYAPGSGVVIEVFLSETYSSTVKIRMTKTFSYYLDHISPYSNISVGTTVNAGEAIGLTAKDSIGVDLGVINTDITLAFISLNRYPSQTIHTDSPLKYYEEPLKSQLYAKVLRTGADKDGKIDYDQQGKLVGNWFHESVPSNSSDETSAIAFVYNSADPSQICISIGGILSMVGRFTVQSNATDPANVSVQTAKVSYKLYEWDPNPTNPSQVGLLIVQMLDDNKIKVEAFNGSTADTAEFTSNSKTYVR